MQQIINHVEYFEKQNLSYLVEDRHVIFYEPVGTYKTKEIVRYDIDNETFKFKDSSLDANSLKAVIEFSSYFKRRY